MDELINGSQSVIDAPLVPPALSLRTAAPALVVIAILALIYGKLAK